MQIDDLKPAPYNPREMDSAARAALRTSLTTFGDISGIVYSADRGHLICGHQRLKALQEQHGEELRIEGDGENPALVTPDGRRFPIRVVSGWSEAEEKAANIAANSDLLAGEFTPALGPLIDNLQGEAPELSEDLRLSELEPPKAETESGHAESEPEATPDDEQLPLAWQQSAVYKGANPWDLPDLLPERIGAAIPTMTYTGRDIPEGETALFLWGSNKPPEGHQGHVLGFYTDDARFEAVWKKAVASREWLLKYRWDAVLAPDFSMWRTLPLALQLYNLYRSRWCARYWQEAGLDVIPSLNWSDERTYEWAFAGIPEGLPVVACQARTLHGPIEQRFFLQGLREGVKRLQPEKVLIYGLAARSWAEPQLPEGPEYHWVEDFTSARRREQAYG